MVIATLVRLCRLPPPPPPHNRHSLPLLSSCHSHPFSSSTPPPPPDDASETPSQSQAQSPSPSSYLDEIKAKLRQSRRPCPPRATAPPPSPILPSPSKLTSLEEIRNNLSYFRRRSAAPSSHPPPISFQEIYRSNVISSENPSSSPPAGGPASPSSFSFESIRESIRQIRPSPPTHPSRPQRQNNLNSFSLQAFKDTLNLKPSSKEPLMPSAVSSVFPPAIGDKAKTKGRTELARTYSYAELGEKLMHLRPKDVGEKDWFSLGELNERLRKLREMEDMESELRIGGCFMDLRDSLVQLKKTSDENTKKNAVQRLTMLGHMRGQAMPSFMLSPPKEHLVEKYFHPDNMSSAEKLKLELKRVRDEFKMSESDCGSTRVQVAQLTTKIKHLSSVLHKKDKHSRKGIQEMVQRRKKLLKYLRTTDWDSYCLVLSKLGLRDNPGYRS